MKTKLILIALTALILIGGCKPIHDISYVDRWHETVKTDSVYKFEKDTMFINQKGDTVFITKIKTLVDYKYKYLNNTDTVTKIETKTKTVYQTKTVTTTTWFGWADWILFGLAFLYLAYRVLKFFKVIKF
jgi:hypothetical protein